MEYINKHIFIKNVYSVGMSMCLKVQILEHIEMIDEIHDRYLSRSSSNLTNY